MRNYPVRPIHFCLDNILNCMKLNNDEFQEVIKNLLENEKLSKRIKLDSTGGWQEFAVRVRNGQILINECFLTLLWCVSYYTLLINNNFLLPFLNGENICNDKLKLAQDALDYGMSLKYGDDEWPANIPHSREVGTNEDVYVANFICSIAANFIVSHEIAHKYHEHQIWALSLMAIGGWNSKFNKNIEFYPNEEKSYKEQFAELLEKLMSKNK